MYITVTIYFIDCQIEVSRSLRLDLVFVLDASGSILAENFEAMKRSVQQIVSPLNISNDTSRVAVIVFSAGITSNLPSGKNATTTCNGLSHKAQVALILHTHTHTHTHKFNTYTTCTLHSNVKWYHFSMV